MKENEKVMQKLYFPVDCEERLMKIES